MHDSHIHLALQPLKDNWKRDIKDFLDNGGKKILTQSTDLEDLYETLELAQIINKEFQKNVVDCALGIHPTVFQENFGHREISEIYSSCDKFLKRFLELFNKNKSDIKAIGETGLDYYEMYTNSLSNEAIEILKEVQKISFKEHIRIAKENSLPLSIHAREIEGKDTCIKDVLRIVASDGKGEIKGCFHSYTGKPEFVKEILDLGFCIGFNAIITYPSGQSVRDVLKMVPEENILFETDGPFLPVQSIRKNKKALIKYARPSQIREIINVASEIKDISSERLEEISDNNYNRIFN
jgi:TatD DNase family protein